MHQIARVVAAAALTLSATAGLNAQDSRPTPQISALNAVIGYRLNWIGDSTAFDACSVYRRIAPREQVTSGLSSGVRSWFTASASPCIEGARVDRRRETRVLVDSLALSDSTGRVWMTVRRGEKTHREEYWLVSPSPGRSWAVDRVVFSGATRTYWVRPDGPQPPP